MITMSFPTQGIVEKCLIDAFGKLSKVSGFPTLSKGCLTPSIKTIGTIPECHFCPGTYGVLSKSVPSLTGVDIPILVRADEEQRKTVAIVAQDPLRDPKTLPSHHLKKVIVGTPFAYHNDVLCCPQTLVYRKIIQGLLIKGYNVYVTDIWKCWFNNIALNKSRGPWKSGNPYFDCLAEEMNCIKPDYVILMGGQAKQLFNDVAFQKVVSGLEMDVVPVFHPSNTANGAWKKNCGGCTPCYKVKYVLDRIP